ncbi:archaellin/type IV pilin N-terminal domain-containing protein [Natrarchaeobaculum sulfurireducens]|uniref:Flagellin n=1 Tax=Natrarchaeobaculum sulfurireducens TaxID=2044521 RepID=A0A346PGX2_9EURY|nr:archaellin/type IV pilin N-terminal domain-containing protein [Natrarchaeobaculum sulfurireducens]AXR78767.1 Archaeal flagellin [Natrarchaeobaculum sulfurireducens]
MFVDNNGDDRGQVGIGTLIVFIAMVLVAAIAAGVLINTAGFLQAQAEATGEESTELVSERIDATSTVGIVDSADDGTLDEIRVGVTAAAGADDISLEETVVQVVGPEGQANLVYDEDVDDESDVDDLSTDQPTFAAMDNSGDFIEPDNAVLDSDNGDFTLVFNPETDPFGDDDSEVFGEGDEAALDIVSPASATTQVELRAPDLFNDDGEAVRL